MEAAAYRTYLRVYARVRSGAHYLIDDVGPQVDIVGCAAAALGVADAKNDRHPDTMEQVVGRIDSLLCKSMWDKVP